MNVNIDVDTSAWDPDSLPVISGADELVLLGNDSMRARRRPRAILFVWLVQVALSFAFAWPIAKGVSAVWGAFPHGDAVLWESGGLTLLDTALKQHALRSSAIALLAIVLFASALVELVPLGALLASIAFVTRDRRAPRLADAIARGARAFPTFFTLLVGSSAVGVLVLALAGWTSLALAGGLTERLGDARAEQIGWLAGIAIALVAGWIGVAQDLARAAAIRFRVRTIRALRFAMNTLGRGWMALMWAWGWRALAAWVPVAVSAFVAGRLGGRSGAPLVALAVVHQLTTLARVALRASWLAAAVRAVDHAHRVVRR